MGSVYEDAGLSAFPPPDYSLSHENSDMLSPTSTDTALTFSNTSAGGGGSLRTNQHGHYDNDSSSNQGFINHYPNNIGPHNKHLLTPDLFCSDVDYGYDSANGALVRPTSMFETLPQYGTNGQHHINRKSLETILDPNEYQVRTPQRPTNFNNSSSKYNS